MWKAYFKSMTIKVHIPRNPTDKTCHDAFGGIWRGSNDKLFIDEKCMFLCFSSISCIFAKKLLL